ncbi:TetR/AcrR family transcriptional regulator [Corticimicrobacter populi]|uniref:TetR family transcriptional regulator n=1 Tax=Corticimicrobacter populi TaxID=2175229 RepID=A0A2V1K572_9BURK|nr:TetR/AcrR family transcriptional regulator [Corticimicrobacter populi]PWF24030.1 TetR family transcriptional regulator [Corticimicrobacter populi]
MPDQMPESEVPEHAPVRKRMSRADRLRQLLDVALEIIRTEGTDALTLGHLAEAAGITKPTVYDHFGTRQGLLAALYRDYDIRHDTLFETALADGQQNLEDLIRTIACGYITCVLTEGREIPGVLAALEGSPELAVMKRQCQLRFLDRCRETFAPFVGPQGLAAASLWAMLGAADALACAAVTGDINEAQACAELYDTMLSMIRRSQPQVD